MPEFIDSRILKDWLCSEFVGNECGSDEYGETQPEKTFHFLTRVMDFMECGERLPELMKAVAVWTEAWDREGGVRYAGSDEASVLYELMFNVLWENGEHPYDDDVHYHLDRILENQRYLDHVNRDGIKNEDNPKMISPEHVVETKKAIKEALRVKEVLASKEKEEKC